MNTDFAKRVRQAVRRWPITELDPIEREAFATAVADARSFEDLEPGWQRMILEAEGGHRRLDAKQFFLHLRRRSVH